MNKWVMFILGFICGVIFIVATGWVGYSVTMSRLLSEKEQYSIALKDARLAIEKANEAERAWRSDDHKELW